MNKIICLTLLSIYFFGSLNLSAKVVFPYAEGGKYGPSSGLVDVDSELTNNDKPVVLYELVNDNLRPEPDEFYLSTIYGSSKDPRALIKRSNNIRSGAIFTGTVEYKIGDKISDHYRIYDIDFRHREVIVRNIDTKEFFALKLSYGTATSKLIKKIDYIPKKRQRKPHKKKPELVSESIVPNEK
jgi:hypothetical protein